MISPDGNSYYVVDMESSSGLSSINAAKLSLSGQLSVGQAVLVSSLKQQQALISPLLASLPQHVDTYA